MKAIAITAAAAFSLLFVSCSSMDLGGSVPLPFTEPPTNAVLELDLRPLPPRFCIGVDLIPGEIPEQLTDDEINAAHE